MELRCDNDILFGILEGRTLEVKCRSRRCGHEAGTVVIHQFDFVEDPATGSLTGELKRTLKFKDPANQKGVRTNATRHEPSLRSA